MSREIAWCLPHRHEVLSLSPGTCVESWVSWFIIVIPALGAEPAWPESTRPGREILCLKNSEQDGDRETTLKPGLQPPHAHTNMPREDERICERGTEQTQVRILTLLASPMASNACFSLRTLGSCCIQSRQPAFILGRLARLDEMIHLRKVPEAASVVIAPVVGIRFSVGLGWEKKSHGFQPPVSCPIFLSIEARHLLCARMVGGAGGLPWPLTVFLRLT